jgi:hypothetical protein
MLQNINEIIKPKIAANNMGTILHQKEVHRNKKKTFYHYLFI